MSSAQDQIRKSAIMMPIRTIEQSSGESSTLHESMTAKQNLKMHE